MGLKFSVFLHEISKVLELKTCAMLSMCCLLLIYMEHRSCREIPGIYNLTVYPKWLYIGELFLLGGYSVVSMSTSIKKYQPCFGHIFFLMWNILIEICLFGRKKVHEHHWFRWFGYVLQSCLINIDWNYSYMKPDS